MPFLAVATTLFLLLTYVACDAKPNNDLPLHYPTKISYNVLVDNDAVTQKETASSFLNALSDHGMIAIENVPGYSDRKQKTLAHLHACAVQTPDRGFREHLFSDGTIRLTAATQTVPGPGGQQKIFRDSSGNIHSEGDVSTLSEACVKFSKFSGELRDVVQQAVAAFSSSLSSLLDVNVPLLSTRNNEYEFDTFEDVVKNGDHLEHFHSYQSTSLSSNNSQDTIDMHTDQGLFIAFTPALLVDALSPTTSSTSTLSQNDFFIQMKDGTRAAVSLDDDDLIIMLGDGVNQYLNPRLVGDVSLRATPHAVNIKGQAESQARVWYGLMVLPPPGAVHPQYSSSFGGSDVTFGELRERAMSTTDSDTNTMTLGCSNGMAARQLEEIVCEDDSLYCWHRCMVHADYGVSQDICASRNLALQCINPRGQLYEGGHGDYYPACSNTTDPVTPYPTLPTFPRDENMCDDAAWETFSSSEGYDFVFDKLGDNRGNRGYNWDGALDKGGNVSKFMWNVVDTNVIEGKLVFNALFGFLAFGFSHPGGNKRGMHGAPIIMAIPGGNYTAHDGLNMSLPATIQEYKIDLDESAFRHWSTPLPNRDTSTYDIITTSCHTAITFKTNNINDRTFNITGVDGVLWAGNGQDSFVGYHGRGDGTGDRDMFYVEWNTGKAWFPVENAIEDPSSSAIGMNGLVALVVNALAMLFAYVM